MRKGAIITSLTIAGGGKLAHLGLEEAFGSTQLRVAVREWALPIITTPIALYVTAHACT